MPGRVLLWSTTTLVIFSFMIPYIPVAGLFGFVRLEPWLLLAIAGVAVLYVGATELAKRRFYRITGAVRRQIEIRNRGEREEESPCSPVLKDRKKRRA